MNLGAMDGKKVFAGLNAPCTRMKRIVQQREIDVKISEYPQSVNS